MSKFEANGLSLAATTSPGSEAPTPKPGAPARAELTCIGQDGLLVVRTDDGLEFSCEYLEPAWQVGPPLKVGDRLLALLPEARHPGVVLGRLGRYPVTEEQSVPKLVLTSSTEISLRCGEAAIDLRADGKVVIRGDDVLVRAKGTKRIRAGSVSIN